MMLIRIEKKLSTWSQPRRRNWKKQYRNFKIEEGEERKKEIRKISRAKRADNLRYER